MIAARVSSGDEFPQIVSGTFHAHPPNQTAPIPNGFLAFVTAHWTIPFFNRVSDDLLAQIVRAIQFFSLVAVPRKIQS